MGYDIDIDEIDRAADYLLYKYSLLLSQYGGYKSQKSSKIAEELSLLTRDILYGKISPKEAFTKLNKLESKISRLKIPDSDKKLLKIKLTLTRLQLIATSPLTRQAILSEKEFKARQKKRRASSKHAKKTKKRKSRGKRRKKG